MTRRLGISYAARSIMRHHSLKIILLILVAVLLCHQSVEALYWEDDFPGNDPENEYRVPKGCVLGSVWDKMKRSTAGISNFLLYGGKEQADMGPSLNKRKKGLIILSCAVMGGVTGAIVAVATETEGADRMVYRATAIGVGVMSGVVVGVWVVPESFSYDEQARWINPDIKVSAARRCGFRASILQAEF